MFILPRQFTVTVGPRLRLRLLMLRSALKQRSFHSSACSRATMRVVPIPVRKDNYSYLIIDDTVNEAAAVDPYTPSKVKEAAERLGVKVVAGITTHHHNDHSGGNQEFVSFKLNSHMLNHLIVLCDVQTRPPTQAQLFPGVPIYGGSHRSPALTQLVKGDDQFTIGKTLNVECLATPCHTQDSICYYVTDARPASASEQTASASAGAVFTGDTLFIAGCGVFFEGSGAEMHAAFQRLAALPDATVTYVGHEYTAGNLRFARSIDPDNPALARLGELVAAHGVTVGRTTIGDEKDWNVFWRLTSDQVRTATKTGPDASPTEIMDKLRTLKNNFKG
ncbi:Metallo-hydrolase/oxidoreductase [Russula earlei]|uniref:Metallo-hydrolase/oxidoreductase n=1 Tax=Russula earlei TaxID=71964 RepID=A0ACC0U2Z0_9AGAM|nr:Metallo-hydrolase/oxidoreductase [Russula earlei]